MFEDFKPVDIPYDIKETNYGKGADWIWLLVTFGTMAQLIILGEKIDKGLNGWINVFKKIKKLSKKVRLCKLDDDVLLLYAVSEVFKSDKKLNNITFISKSSIDILNNSAAFTGKPADHFLSKDDAYTIFVFRSKSVIYIVGARIDGQIKILNTIEIQ